MDTKGFRARLRDSSGATAIEYAMIVAGIGLFLLAASALVGRGAETTFSAVGGSVEPTVHAQPGTSAPTVPLPPTVRDPDVLTPVPAGPTSTGNVKNGAGNGNGGTATPGGGTGSDTSGPGATDG